MTTIDVGAVLDEGQWSGYQKLLVVATALTIILDGVDNQLIGAAVPSLMKEWSLPRAAFAPLFATGMIGMMIGGFIGGVVGDRFRPSRGAPRQRHLVWCADRPRVACGGFLTLAVLRFFAGLASVAPCQTPPRCRLNTSRDAPAVRGDDDHRVIPLGGTLAGLMGSEILPRFAGGRSFLVGGVVPSSWRLYC